MNVKDKPCRGGTCMPCYEARVCLEMSLWSIVTTQKSDTSRSD